MARFLIFRFRIFVRFTLIGTLVFALVLGGPETIRYFLAEPVTESGGPLALIWEIPLFGAVAGLIIAIFAKRPPGKS